jgi:hypothetical protein
MKSCTQGSSVAIRDGLRDDADIGDARLAKRVDDTGEGAEGNGLIATKEDGVVGMLLLGFDLGGKIVNVNGAVAKIESLIFVDGDDEMILIDFFDGVRFGDVDFDAGLKDGRGDHEDDQKDEDHVDKRDHVDFGEGGLRGFG